MINLDALYVRGQIEDMTDEELADIRERADERRIEAWKEEGEEP